MSTVQTGVCECGTPVERETLEGPFGDYLAAVPFVCDSCVQRHEKERDERDRRDAAEQAEMWRTDRVRRSQLPSALQAISLDKLDQDGNRDAFAAAKRWAGGEIKSLVLTGPYGSGKTTIAAGAMLLRVHSQFVRWVSAPELLSQLGSGFGDRQRDLATDALLGAGGLVLDDIDKIRPTEYGAEQLFVAINNCIENERPVIVTTNLGMAELAARYPSSFGEAIASRLGGFDEGHRVTGRDRRLS